MQSKEIPTTGYMGMDAFCGGMGLCSPTFNYFQDIATISPTLQVKAIPFNNLAGTFGTPYGDVGTGFCSPEYSPECIRTPLSLKAVQTLGKFPGTNQQYVSNYIDVDESGFGQTTLRSTVRNFTFNGVQVDLNPVVAMIAAPNTMDGLATSHYSKVLHSGEDGVYLLIIKIAVHNIAYENQPYNNQPPNQNQSHTRNFFTDVFNNTQYMFPIVDTLVHPNDTLTLISPSSLVYTVYQYGDYAAIDVVQKSLCYYSTPLMKARVLLSVYHITDSSISFSQTSPPADSFLTNYNRTEYIYSLDAGKVPFVDDTMLKNFNEPPSSDLFMYGLAASGALYGSTGEIEVAADLTLPFVLFSLGICLIMTLIWVISRARYNSFYFESLLLVLGGNVTVPSLTIGQNNVCVVNTTTVDVESDQRLINNDKYDAINP
ncbi:hypothetical protein BGZ76_009426 [Entomortierella beljakovae]|nr:hypothetical protein BGZ76_009426 [Entomortierella beljakovae]